MTDNLNLKNIIDVKRKNPYRENKTIAQLREETEDAGKKIPLPKHTKFKRVSVGNIDAEWITCGEFESDKIFLFMHGGGYYRGSIASTRATVARISAEAKVDVQLEVWKDMFHGWHGSAHILKDGEKAIKNIGLFCRDLFNHKSD